MSPEDEIRLLQSVDRSEIVAVQMKYATSIDSLNWEQFATCFGEKLTVDFSGAMGLPVVYITGDEWVENTKNVLGPLKATQHVIANYVVTFADADHATCVAGFRARHHHPNPAGDSDQTAYGYYSNEFERTSKGWRMTKLKATGTWSTGNSGIFTLTSSGAKWCGLSLVDGKWQKG